MPSSPGQALGANPTGLLWMQRAERQPEAVKSALREIPRSETVFLDPPSMRPYRYSRHSSQVRAHHSTVTLLAKLRG